LFLSSRRRHTRSKRDWSSDVCSSDLFWTKAPSTRNRSAELMLCCSRQRMHVKKSESVKEAVELAVRASWLTPMATPLGVEGQMRSEERRVGKECGSGW